MRIQSYIAAVSALFFATALAAQTPPVANPLVPPALEPENTLVLDLTTGGRVSIQLRPDIAPNTVERVKALARRGFYNGTIFHRVIEGFMAQGGDPTGTGTGGSELPDLNAEFSKLPHVRGAVAAARAESVNSANSQFYIMLAPRLSLDNKYTVFGRVVSGMPFVDTIERGEPPANPTRIVKASVGTDNAAPPSPAEVEAAKARPLPAPTVAAPAPAPTSLPDTPAAPPTPEPAPTPAPTPSTPTTATPEPAPTPGEAVTEPAQPAPEPTQPTPEPTQPTPQPTPTPTPTPPAGDDPTPQ